MVGVVLILHGDLGLTARARLDDPIGAHAQHTLVAYRVSRAELPGEELLRAADTQRPQDGERNGLAAVLQRADRRHRLEGPQLVP